MNTEVPVIQEVPVTTKILNLLQEECKTSREVIGALEIVSASIILALEDHTTIHRNKLAHDLCKGIKACVPRKEQQKEKTK